MSTFVVVDVIWTLLASNFFTKTSVCFKHLVSGHVGTTFFPVWYLRLIFLKWLRCSDWEISVSQAENNSLSL